MSCHVSLAILLTAVVITSSPISLLLLLLRRPRPGPCCRPRRRCCCCAFPVLAAAADAAIPCCRRRVAPALAAVVVYHVHPRLCPCALVRPCHLALALAPSRPRPAFACFTLAPRCRRQRRPLSLPSAITINSSAQLMTIDNDHQNPLEVISHRGRRWQSSLSAAAVDGCGSNGIFATAINDNNRPPTVGSIPPPPPSMITIIDKDRHFRRHYQPPTQPTMTAITMVNDNDWSRWLHPTVASIDDDRCQQRPVCQRTLGWRHQRRARPPSDPSHRCLRRQRSSLTKTAIAAVNYDDQRCWLHPTAASAKDDRC